MTNIETLQELRGQFQERAQAISDKLDKALEGDNYQQPEFLELVLQTTMIPHESHNNKTNPQFYNSLYAHLLDSIQQATPRDILVSCACAYIDKIEFGGFAPRFATSVVLGDSYLLDVEPVFNVWCRDSKYCPLSTLSFRFAIGKDLQIRFAMFNVGWLKTVVDTDEMVDVRFKYSKGITHTAKQTKADQHLGKNSKII